MGQLRVIPLPEALAVLAVEPTDDIRISERLLGLPALQTLVVVVVQRLLERLFLLAAQAAPASSS